MSRLSNPFLKMICGSKVYNTSPKIREDLLQRVITYSSNKILNFCFKKMMHLKKLFSFDSFFINENYDA